MFGLPPRVPGTVRPVRPPRAVSAQSFCVGRKVVGRTGESSENDSEVTTRVEPVLWLELVRWPVPRPWSDPIAWVILPAVAWT